MALINPIQQQSLPQFGTNIANVYLKGLALKQQREQHAQEQLQQQQMMQLRQQQLNATIEQNRISNERQQQEIDDKAATKAALGNIASSVIKSPEGRAVAGIDFKLGMQIDEVIQSGDKDARDQFEAGAGALLNVMKMPDQAQRAQAIDILSQQMGVNLDRFKNKEPNVVIPMLEGLSASKGGVKVINQNYPAPKFGERYITDPETGEVRIEPVPGGPQDRLSVGDSARHSMTIHGMEELTEAAQYIFENGDMEKGKVDRGTITQMMDYSVMGLGPAGVPWTVGRIARQRYLGAMEGKLRLESGAAVPDSEVERMMVRFMPSLLDSDEGIRSKVKALNQFLTLTEAYSVEGVRAAELNKRDELPSDVFRDEKGKLHQMISQGKEVKLDGRKYIVYPDGTALEVK